MSYNLSLGAFNNLSQFTISLSEISNTSRGIKL